MKQPEFNKIINECVEKMKNASSKDVCKMRQIYNKHLNEDCNNEFNFIMAYDRKEYVAQYNVSKDEYSITDKNRPVLLDRSDMYNTSNITVEKLVS